LKWVYDDCESGFSFDTQRLYGFEIMPMVKEDRHKSRTVEQLYCNVREFCESIKDDEVGIYVVDSLDGTTSTESDSLANERYSAHKKGKDFDKGSYKMGKPKYLSGEFFPQLSDLLEKKNVLLIIISQVRQNIDPMSFEEFTRSGGLAMDLYAHSVLWLANTDKNMKKGRAIGIRFKSNNKKSKTPRPYRITFIDILFNYGIDNTASNVDFLYDFLTPTGKLIKDPKAIWESNPREENLETLKLFLQNEGIKEKYRTTINPKLKKSEVLEYIRSKKTMSKRYDEFIKGENVEMSRKDLITYIEDNDLRAELEKKVIDKWEEIETSILEKRRTKYA
jgi:hypothetical protein